MFLSFTLLMIWIPALIAVAFFTLLERKFLGYAQHRKGPNKPSIGGFLVPFADAMKLLTKEVIIPLKTSGPGFNLAPLSALAVSFLLWSLAPVPYTNLGWSLSLFFFLMVTTLGVYPLLFSGWESVSSYGMLGAIRGVAQYISYEISFALCVLAVLLTVSTLEILETGDLLWRSGALTPLLPMFCLWWISGIAETNRSPFDFAEGESELVSGFNVEHGGTLFTLIFLAEYASILGFNFIWSFMVWAHSLGNCVPLILSIVGVLWLRASFPRYRYDKLMSLAWESFLPLTLGFVLFSFSIAI